jgi:serine/threonine protein kinase
MPRACGCDSDSDCDRCRSPRRIGNLHGGAFGTVEALEMADGSRCAEKTSSLFDGNRIEHLALNEALLAMLLRDIGGLPGLVEYYGARVDRGEGKVVLSQQFAQHWDLEELVKRPAIHSCRSAAIAAVYNDVVPCLHGLHRIGILHGDIKPANLVVVAWSSDADTMQMRVTDLGAARMVVSHALPNTLTPNLLGDFKCLPPESFLPGWRPRTPDLLFKADAWAVGVVLHWLIFRCSMCEQFADPANRARPDFARLHSSYQVAPKSRSCPPGVSEEHFNTMLQLLHPDPEERLSISDLYLRLRGGSAATAIQVDFPTSVNIDPEGLLPPLKERSARIDKLFGMCNRKHGFTLACNLADRCSAKGTDSEAHLMACVDIADGIVYGGGEGGGDVDKAAVMDVLQCVGMRVLGDTCDLLLARNSYSQYFVYSDVVRAVKQFPRAADAAAEYMRWHPVHYS